MSTIMETLNNIVNEIETTNNSELCKQIYNLAENNINIDTPYDISNKLIEIRDKAHKRYTQLMSNRNNTIIENLNNSFSCALRNYRNKERQITIMF